MANNILDVYTMGQGRAVMINHTGPKSYTTGGETLGASNTQTGISMFGLADVDLILGGSLSVSGSYWVMAQPVGTGTHKQWKLLWFTATAGVPSLTQVTNGTDLSGETVVIAAIG